MNYQDEYKKFEKIFDKIFADDAVVNILNEPNLISDQYSYSVAKSKIFADYNQFSTTIINNPHCKNIKGATNYIGSREYHFLISKTFNIPYDVVNKVPKGKYAYDDERFVIDELKPNMDLELEDCVDTLIIELMIIYGSNLNDLNLMKIKKHIIIQYLIQTKYIHMIPDNYILILNIDAQMSNPAYVQLLEKLESVFYE